MTAGKATLPMPVENQVGELDYKLFLACIPSRLGVSSVIGPCREMRMPIHITFPKVLGDSRELKFD